MVNTEANPAATKLSAVLPAGAADRVLQELSQAGKDDFDTINLMGWQPVGQRIVYGYERALGFCNSANACAKTEGLYKRLRRARKWERDVYVDGFLAIMVDAIVDRMQNGKG